MKYERQNFETGQVLTAPAMNNIDKGLNYIIGKEIVAGEVNESGELVLAFSDGNTVSLGDITSGAIGKRSVFAYGAKGDGITDDTEAFKAALAANRVVFVPGGTYKLSSEITIGDNRCLELAQDTVLTFTNTTGNCIALGMLSSLRGNHATIKVPYDFAGNVLYAYSNEHNDVESREVPPFTKWDPMWKSGRYVTDINICKADSRGFHYAVNPDECSGAAVYVSADNTAGMLSFMWGIHYSGLRIAGAFKYGIHAINIDDGWVHEMRIDAFIDACEIGVQLEDCSNAYISAVVQPRRAYTLDSVYKPYAKHGIKLVRSKNVDLSGSRVWDWDATNTLWTDDGEYQSYAMIGDCRGALINDFSYFTTSYDIRKRIYTDSDINLDTMRVLQEPITKYFRVLNEEPYYSDGLFEHKLITQEHLDKHFDTGVVKNFNDLLPTAIDTDGSIYNGIGYKKNTYIQSNGVTKEAGYYVATGFIPCTAGSVIYAHDMSFSKGDDNCRIIFYDKNFNVCTYGDGNTTPLLVNRGLLIKNGNTYVAEYTGLSDGFKITLNAGQYGPHGNTAYARLSIYKAVWGENPMIAVDEPIEYTVEGFLADGVKVKGENVIGEIGVGQPDWVAKKKMVGGTEIFIPEQSVSSMMWKNLQIALQSGLVYDVYVDGVLYACEAWGSGQSVYLGNNTSLTRNDYPFCVFWAGGTATSGMFFGEGKKLKVTDHAYYVYDKMPTEYLPEGVAMKDDIPEGGGGSIDVTAEVGQTIVVEEVDDNGKPTKWKAAEYQPRTHWTEKTVVLPETTCEVIEDIGAAMLPDMAISAGDTLTVVFNGTEYTCECADVDGSLAFGNYGVMDEENPVDTGEPFAAVKVDSGDGTLIWACVPLDGSASFTLSVMGEVHNTIPEKYLPVFGTANVYDIPTEISDNGMKAAFEGYNNADVFKLANTPNTIVRLRCPMDAGEDFVLNLRKTSENIVCFGVISFTGTGKMREVLIHVLKNSDMSFDTRVDHNYLNQ
jgi:hypothetical protein